MAGVETGADLEQAHVHQVYDQIAPCFAEISQKAWPNVRKFLKEQTPGSLIADVGCGSGRYLHINNKIFKLGLDICCPLVEFARSKNYDVIVADNLKLPYRDDIFDAVISVGVVHHLSTHERRIQAVQELCRILRPGGQLMIYVWAYEQKHRRFDGQDVLIPWYGKQKRSGNFSRSSYSDRDLSSAGSVSEDDLSVDTTSSTQSLHLGDPDPFENGTSSENSVDVFVDDTVKTGDTDKHLTSRQRSNTLPSTLDRYFKRVDPFVKHSEDSNALVRECRKLEASLKALSSNQHRFSSTDTFESDDLENKEMWPYYVNLNSQSKVKFDVGSLEMLNDAEYDRSFSYKNGDNCDRKIDKLKSISGIENDYGKVYNDILNLNKHCGVNKTDISFKLDESVHTSNGQNSHSGPNFTQCPSYSVDSSFNKSRRKSSHDELTQKLQFWKSKKKTKAKKLSIFESIKATFSSFFDGKSDEKKMKKDTNSIYPKSCFQMDKSEHEKGGNLVGFEEFAVREFPLSSCPMNREELLESAISENDSQRFPLGKRTILNSNVDQKLPMHIQDKGENQNCVHSEIDNQSKGDNHISYSHNVTISNGFLKSIKSKKLNSCSNDYDQSLLYITDSFIQTSFNSALPGVCSESTSGIETKYLNGYESNLDLNGHYIDEKVNRHENRYNCTKILDVEEMEKVPFDLNHGGEKFFKRRKQSDETSNKQTVDKHDEMAIDNTSQVFDSGKDKVSSDEMSTKRSTHLCRYYHVFREGEIDNLVLKNIPNVKIVRSSHDHANWCLVVEKIDR